MCYEFPGSRDYQRLNKKLQGIQLDPNLIRKDLRIENPIASNIRVTNMTDKVSGYPDIQKRSMDNLPNKETCQNLGLQILHNV